MLRCSGVYPTFMLDICGVFVSLCVCVCTSRPLFPRVLMFWIVVVVGVSFVENPHEPRGGTCAPGVRRAACLSEGPACSTGWAFFGFWS